MALVIAADHEARSLAMRGCCECGIYTVGVGGRVLSADWTRYIELLKVQSDLTDVVSLSADEHTAGRAEAGAAAREVGVVD